MKLTTGTWDISAAEYHADPCVAPSLSSGIAWEFLTRSPLHAWCAHPRLNPGFVPDDDKKFDLGTVAHTLILGKGEQIQVIDAEDYRTKEARGMREMAVQMGLTPILSEQYERARKMRDRVYDQLRRHEIGNIFERQGFAERAVIWRDECGVWCRCLPDWTEVAPKEIVVTDLKTTTNAHPNVWRNRVEQIGFCFKASFYMRGIAAVTGCPNIRWRWVTVEAEQPHAIAVYEPDPADLIAAEQDVADLIVAFGECLRTDVWPGYPPKVMQLPLSGGYRMRQEARQESGEISPAAIQQAIEWQKGMMA